MRRGILALLALSLLVAACGRPGPVRPPGPQDQITYPRTYPSR
jgi:predicted small lipoprotein YifL